MMDSAKAAGKSKKNARMENVIREKNRGGRVRRNKEKIKVSLHGSTMDPWLCVCGEGITLIRGGERGWFLVGSLKLLTN
jgi:hypothetical protein